MAPGGSFNFRHRPPEKKGGNDFVCVVAGRLDIREGYALKAQSVEIWKTKIRPAVIVDLVVRKLVENNPNNPCLDRTVLRLRCLIEGNGFATRRPRGNID